MATSDNYYKLKKKFKTDLNEYEVRAIVIRKHSPDKDLVKIGLFIHGVEERCENWYIHEGTWRNQLDDLALKTIEMYEDWELIEGW